MLKTACKLYILKNIHSDPLQNDSIVTSQCLHLLFCRGRKVKLTDQSVQPVTKKREEGSREIDSFLSQVGGHCRR